MAAQPASPKLLVSVASQAPGRHRARQLCRAGEPSQRHLCSSCLLLLLHPGVTPTEGGVTFPQKTSRSVFPDAASLQQDQVRHLPAFTRRRPRSRAVEPGFGRCLPDQVFAVILPGADPHPRLSSQEPGHLPPSTPFPQHCGVGS